MKKFTVKFFWANDLRYSIEVETCNEVQALSVALVQLREASWCDVYSAKVTIELSE
jgi:hypothetical protein